MQFYSTSFGAKIAFFSQSKRPLPDKQHGIVKEFCEEKRFGTIASYDNHYFVHLSALGKNLSTLNKGESVLFKAGNGAKKLHAEEVELIEC